jgi:hypothetical protein
MLDVKGSDSHVPGTRFGGVPGNGRRRIRTHGLRLGESEGGHPPAVSAWEEATSAAWDLKAASGNSRAWMRKYRPRALRKSRRPTTLQTCAEIAGSRMPSTPRRADCTSRSKAGSPSHQRRGFRGGVGQPLCGPLRRVPVRRVDRVAARSGNAIVVPATRGGCLIRRTGICGRQESCPSIRILEAGGGRTRAHARRAEGRRYRIEPGHRYILSTMSRS